MTTVPEEAVKAAAMAHTPQFANMDPTIQKYALEQMRAALTAAINHLPQGVGVNIDEIVQPLEDIHAPGGLCRWTDVATAIGEVRRALRSLEPSATRELALEEIIALCRDYGEDSQPDSEYRLACNDIIEAIQERRALSSPDHADAGNVEGDGSAAARDVLAERRRQIEAEGWTPEHDRKVNAHGELAKAATCYASVYPLAASYWPWDLKWWKPSGRRRNLVKAAALILAEIERLDRLSVPASEGAE